MTTVISIYAPRIRGASLVAQMVKNLPAMRRPRFNPWVGKIPWRREWQPTSVFWPGESHEQESGGLQSMELERVGHDWVTNTFTFHPKTEVPQFSSVTQSCPTLCDPMNRRTTGLPVHHKLREFTQNSCLLSRWCHPAISSSVTPFSSCPQLSQHQGLFQWINSSHQVAKVLEFQLQHQSFDWTPRTDLL